MNVNICFHTLQVSRYPKTHVDMELPSVYWGFWMFSLEIPQNKQVLRGRDYLIDLWLLTDFCMTHLRYVKIF